MPSYTVVHRPAFLALAAGLLLHVACRGLPDQPVPLPAMADVGAAVPLPAAPERQFDFWLGEWAVQNLHVERDGSWQKTGTARARIDAVAGGNAVLERWTGEAKHRLIGFSLRSFDPALGAWQIYLNWHGGKPGGFFLMHGERNGERIELFPPGDTRRTRYTFSRPHAGSCQWDSAVSEDGERWITDWVMQFTRRGEPQVLDAASTVIVEPPAAAAAYPETRRLDALIGAWRGEARAREADGSWTDGEIEVRVTSMIEGFGLLQLTDTTWGGRSLLAMGWDRQADGWVAVRADSAALGLLRLTGRIEDGGVAFTAGESPGDVRERWQQETDDRYRWQRAVHTDDGWRTVLEAALARVP